MGDLSAKRAVLQKLSFGERIAEDEKDALASYFVETDQWARVASGEVDVIFGPKGSGKSAIYTTLLNRESSLPIENVVLISGENPRGSTAFGGLVLDPPTSEVEFVSIWKTYILSLLGSFISDYGLSGGHAERVKSLLVIEGLLPGQGAKLATRLKLVLEWVKQRLGSTSLEVSANLDALSAAPVGFSGQITLGEPSVAERRNGAVSLDDLLDIADKALQTNQVVIWLLFDRLDVAFPDSRQLEANGIRALFRTYSDLRAYDSIAMKIFLRSDIWDEITTGSGFREASHISRKLDIKWTPSSLLNLVVSRAAGNEELLRYYEASRSSVMATLESQRQFFDRLVPRQVDVGKNPKTFDWILGRVKDGTGRIAPREVIHLLTKAGMNR